jgi:pimeloyl-ACP methyl ester carboxylesterase
MRGNLGRLVSFRTIDDFEIIGMLYQSKISSFIEDDVYEIAKRVDIEQVIVIHIHGNYGNFYQNKFLWYMSEIYLREKIDFLVINLSSHDGMAEGYYGKELKYIGGGLADYKDSQLDIAAAVDYVKSLGYRRIVLQGHSLGCDKIIEFALNHNELYPLILLSPVDSYAVQSAWISPETVEEQIDRLNKGCRGSHLCWGSADLDWLSCKEYGAEGDTSDWTYEIPITREALISILEGSAFQNLNVKNEGVFSLENSTFAYIGIKDGLQMHSQSKWNEFLKKSFINYFPVLDLDADHDAVGIEIELSERIVEWIKKLNL